MLRKNRIWWKGIACCFALLLLAGCGREVVEIPTEPPTEPVETTEEPTRETVPTNP